MAAVFLKLLNLSISASWLVLVVLVLGVLSQKLFFKRLNAIEIAVAIEVGSLFHCGKGSPALGINYVGIFESFFHAVGLSEGAAGLLGVCFSDFLDLGHYIVAFGMSKNDLHAESCEQTYNALRY